MRDAHALAAPHLVARAHDVAACAHFDLRRPAQSGQQCPPRPPQRWRTVPTSCVQRHRPSPRPCDRVRWRRRGSASRGCSAATGSPSRPRAAPAGRRSGPTARRWRRACTTGSRPGCGVAGIGIERVFHHVVARGADRVHEQLSGERRQANRSRTSRLSMAKPHARAAPPAPRSPAPRRRCRTAAATAVSRRRRSRPSSSPTPAASTARRRRGRTRSWSRSSACRDSAHDWSAARPAASPSSSVTTSAPAGNRWAMRACDAVGVEGGDQHGCARRCPAIRSARARRGPRVRSPTAVTSCT